MNAKNWFVWTEDNCFEYFSTQTEAVSATKSLIPKYFDGCCWEDKIESIIIGCMIHEIVEVDRIERLNNLDEDNCDTQRNGWGDRDYKCDYKLKLISSIETTIVEEIVEIINSKPVDKFYRNVELEHIATLDKLILEGKFLPK